MAESISDLVVARIGDDRVGLVFEDRTWSWGEVVEESLARASLLRQSGLAGKHIGVLLDNLPEYFFLLCAAAVTGSVVVGANDTRRGEALAGDLRHTDCAVVLTDSIKVGLLAGVDVIEAKIDHHTPVAAVGHPSHEKRLGAQRLPGVEGRLVVEIDRLLGEGGGVDRPEEA